MNISLKTTMEGMKVLLIRPSSFIKQSENLVLINCNEQEYVLPGVMYGFVLSDNTGNTTIVRQNGIFNPLPPGVRNVGAKIDGVLYDFEDMPPDLSIIRKLVNGHVGVSLNLNWNIIKQIIDINQKTYDEKSILGSMLNIPVNLLSVFIGPFVRSAIANIKVDIAAIEALRDSLEREVWNDLYKTSVYINTNSETLVSENSNFYISPTMLLTYVECIYKSMYDSLKDDYIKLYIRFLQIFVSELKLETFEYNVFESKVKETQGFVLSTYEMIRNYI